MNSLPYLAGNDSDSLLRSLLAVLPGAVVAVDVEQRIVALNRRFLELVGWTEEFGGQKLGEVLRAWSAQGANPRVLEDYFRTTLRKVPAPGETVELTPRSGQLLKVHCVAGAGDAQGFHRFWHFEEESPAIAWVGHEIRNPLNAVLSFSDQLGEALERGAPNEAARTALRGLRLGTKQLQAVLGDSIGLLHRGTGTVETRPEWVEVSSILSDLELLYRSRLRRRGLEFLVEATGSEGTQVWVDPGKLGQLLGNLLANALRFTKRGWVALRVARKDQAWEFVVEDSGIGMAVEASTGRPAGPPSQGQVIARILAQSLGAEVIVHSEPGHGTRFTVAFPHLKSRGPQGTFPNEATAPQQEGITVLVADDERTNQLLVRGFLRNTNITVLEATDGLQAVELWNTKRPQLVLMDLRMPWLSGLEAARRIRAMDPHGSTRLLAMSASKPSEFEIAEGRPLWSGYLEKPFSKQDILKFLSKHLTIVDDSVKSS